MIIGHRNDRNVRNDKNDRNDRNVVNRGFLTIDVPKVPIFLRKSGNISSHSRERKFSWEIWKDFRVGLLRPTITEFLVASFSPHSPLRELNFEDQKI